MGGGSLERSIADDFPKYIGQLAKIEQPLYPPRFSTPGEALRHYRKSQNYTAEQLAEKAGMYKSDIISIEKECNKKPTLKRVESLANGLFPDGNIEGLLNFYINMRVLPEEISKALEAVRIYLRGEYESDMGITWTPETIRSLRKKMGLNQVKFGKLIGCSQAAVSYMETERSRIMGPVYKILDQISLRVEKI